MPSIKTIPDTQCIGDSLGTINDNFSNLNVGINNNTTSITSLSSQYSNTLPGVSDAWVVFDGTKNEAGTSVLGTTNRYIKSQYNVSSVYRNSKGNYTITFITPMNNANYAVAGLNSAGAAGLNMAVYSSAGPGGAPTDLTTSTVRVVFGNGTDTYDTQYGSVIIFSL